ncbi:MAG: 50S ribosomal protein L3 [Bacillota bacterium]
MSTGILGKKLGMTQVFSRDGRAVPVTVIEAGPCPIVQIKTAEMDGYTALQLGFGAIKDKSVKKPIKAHFKKADVNPTRYLREVDVADPGKWQVGQNITVDIFNEGEAVDVVGISKGKGFTGMVKRWNFNRGPMSHGSMYHRRSGSLGATDPARVFKGRRLAGHAGQERVTIQGLKIVKVDKDRNLLLVLGSVPGIKGSLVMIKKSMKSSK